MQNNEDVLQWMIDVLEQLYERGRNDGYDLHIYDNAGDGYPNNTTREEFMKNQLSHMQNLVKTLLCKFGFHKWEINWNV